MAFQVSKAKLLAGVCAVALCAAAMAVLEAQAPPAGQGRGGFGGRGGQAANVFTAVDVNRDGFATRDELKAAFAKWLADGDTAKTGSVTQEQLASALNAALGDVSAAAVDVTQFDCAPEDEVAQPPGRVGAPTLSKFSASFATLCPSGNV